MQERGTQDFDYNRMLRKHAKTLRLKEQAYFREKAEKNLMIPLLPPSGEDAVKAERVHFKQDRKKMIKKMIKKEEEETGSSERNRLKEKMRKMTPKFRRNLQCQIKEMNKPTTAFSKH